MIDGKETSNAEISKIMQNEKNIELRKKAYEAKLKGGDLIAEDLIEFAKIRNEFAITKGYKNFFEYLLKFEKKQKYYLLAELYYILILKKLCMKIQTKIFNNYGII